MRFLGIDLDLLTPAERRDLANALLRAAWSAALEDTRTSPNSSAIAAS
jgi:AMMECR1 domain-containing protein